jgi:putative ABC transport system substrate-binding protein
MHRIPPNVWREPTKSSDNRPIENLRSKIGGSAAAESGNPMKAGKRREPIRHSRKVPVFGFTLCALLLALCPSAPTQQSNQLPQIGALYASPVGNATRLAALRQGLRELGYVDGKNIVIQYRYAEGEVNRYPTLTGELVRLKVQIIITGGPAGTRAAQQATAVIPIVMAQDNDPVGNGFVASLARPGGNITGLSTLGAAISGKQMELLKEIIPKLSRVTILGTSTEPANAQSVKEAERAAEALRVEIQYLDVLSAKDFAPAFQTAKNARVDAVLSLSSAVAASQRKQIAELALQSRLPAIYPHAEFVRDGGLMAYGVSFPDLDKRAATYVDKILKGSKAGDLPVEQPTKFELVINLKAARQIGLTIPPNVLARADRVIR